MAKGKSFEQILKEFVKKYEEKNELDEKLKVRILKEATSYNKESIMIELLKRINEYRMYEDETEFPYQVYLSKFMQGIPKQMIEEEDFS